MSFSFRRFLQGINLISKGASTADTAGDLEFVTNKLNLHNGTTVSPVVTEAHAATLTNKTLDTATNTITNLADANISASAAIDASKIANGSVSNTEYQYLDGVTSAIQTQLNGKGPGSVTTVSVVSANGLAGTVANPTSTPAITLSTSVTGLLKGNGTAISAATSGTDYAPATSGTSILKANGAGGFSNAVSATDYAPATTGTSILKASSGGFANAVSGTDYAPATSGTSFLKGDGSGGFSNVSSTGSGNVVLDTAPTLSNPVVGTQSSSDNSTKAASTAYVTAAIANAVAGVNPAVAVQAATTAASDTSGFTYNNGVSGVGATLTGTANTAVTIDGYTFTALNQRLLVKNDTQSPSGAYNGIYYVTQVQTAILPPIFTRALDYNQPSDINNTGAIPVINGTVNGTTSWLLTSSVTTVGTDPLTYTKFSVNPSTILSNTLTNAHIFVGNGSNVATDVAVTGDVTISNTGVTAIGANKVANSQLAQMAAHTFKGNNTGSTANTLDLTATQLTAELNAFVGDSGSGGTKGLVPAPASGDAAANKVLGAGGTWVSQTGGSAVTSIGTIDSQSKSANGLVISSNSLVAQTADSSNPGMVSTATQTLPGLKNLQAAGLPQQTDGSTGNLDALNTNSSQTSSLRLSGAVTALRGIAGGSDGKLLALVNASGSTIPIKNQDANPTAANRIITGTGADVNWQNDKVFLFQYDATTARWRLVGDATTTLTSAHIFVGNSSNIATDVAVTGDMAITNAGVTTVSKVNGVSYSASPATNTVPVVTGSNTITYEQVPVLAGGTGATTASGARTNLGLVIGTDVQAFDAQLSSLIRQNSQSAAYTTVLTDGGKHIFHPSADTTARTFTIDSNANVAYPIGTALTFVNQNSAGVITIAITSDTMRLAGAGTTGSRTLAANGVATALKITSTEWIISGTGLT